VSAGFELRAIGHVESPLAARADAPRQGDEGAPDAVLVFEPQVLPALADVAAGDEFVLLTWLHEADRGTLVVHPRGDTGRPPQGVFTTRSPDRPNPIGLHRVRVRSVDGTRLLVSGLEAIDGTPIVDLKPVLGDVADR
jgi:tRNA-Thr(GGU) m(6)t(6)A37 methyltransferase TsaA